jgi:hypothetical protein
MMKIKILFVSMALILTSFLAFGKEVYRWVDEKGTVHFTDDLGLVPEKYRGQVQRESPPKEPPPPQPAPTGPPSPQPAAPPPVGIPDRTGAENKAAPASGQKDLLGRGEEWWRAKAREWNEKLLNAQKNYENAYREWKSKEQELESSKFKPDSLKRKLKAEIIILEGKAKDLEKQVEEAKDMVEKVLPKQAQDDRANPEWLKIEK